MTNQFPSPQQNFSLVWSQTCKPPPHELYKMLHINRCVEKEEGEFMLLTWLSTASWRPEALLWYFPAPHSPGETFWCLPKLENRKDISGRGKNKQRHESACWFMLGCGTEVCCSELLDFRAISSILEIIIPGHPIPSNSPSGICFHDSVIILLKSFNQCLPCRTECFQKPKKYHKVPCYL